MLPFLAKSRNAPWLVFAMVFAWKVALFAFSAQPVPANDAFFYDGAVVNKLLGGSYTNPTLGEALPISGREVFSAYPPFYQAVLYIWMSVFGTSVLAAMALHLVLFGGYAVVIYQILKRLGTPVWCFHFAGAFLLLLTFHDRPDSLGHLLGMLAVLAFLCSRRAFDNGHTSRPPQLCLWLMTTFIVLGLCTSLQIGTIYLLWIWVAMATTSLAARERFPVVPMAATLAVPVALVLAVRFFLPQCWEGFVEHASQTPSFTGLRVPDLYELLKIARTTPGIFLVAILLPWSWFRQHNDIDPAKYLRLEFVLLPALLGSLGIVAACLFVWTANTVAVANYLQPVIVGTYLALCGTIFAGEKWLRQQVILLSLAVVLGSIRAVGMSTWGIACATDVGYPTAIKNVDAELKALAPGSTAVVSSAFLYQAVRHRDLMLIHSDWMTKAKTGLPDADQRALVKLRPQKLILTQFDYYRRYKATLESARADSALKKIEVVNAAHVNPPDAYPRLQRVVQHISWAPVIVTLTWADR